MAEVRYIAERNPQSADRLLNRMRLLREKLASYPDLGVRGIVPGTRQFVLRPYVVTTRRLAGTVEIVAIRHARQHDAHEPAESRDPDMQSDPAGDDIGPG